MKPGKERKLRLNKGNNFEQFIYMSRLFLILLFLNYGLQSCNQGAESEKVAETEETTTTELKEPVVVVLSPSDYSAAIKAESRPQLIDVRTPEEISQGKIENATNYDINNPDFEKNIDKLDRSKPVYVYCASGKRSARASEILKQAGFPVVYDLRGGYNAWAEAGY